MKFHYLFVLLILGLVSIQCSSGFSLTGIFRRGNTTKKPSSTTPAPAVLSASGSGPSTTNQPAVPQNVNSKLCWWTPCNSRCPIGAQVAGAGQCEGQKGVYKFNCCQNQS